MTDVYPSPAVELQNVAIRFGTSEVFREITLAIEGRDRFALLGPSGCGKSTLLRLIAGLETPSAGTILIGGRKASLPDRTLLAPHDRGLAMVFQDLALWPNLNVRQNVELGLAGTKLGRTRRRERALTALASCLISELADRRPETLSGGQRQRVALARALAVEPKVLLLDEPFSSLDLETKSHLYRTIAKLCGEFDLTLIVVSHDPLEASALCSKAAVLEGGRIREIGALDVLLRDPASATLRSFVSQLEASNPWSSTHTGRQP